MKISNALVTLTLVAAFMTSSCRKDLATDPNPQQNAQVLNSEIKDGKKTITLSIGDNFTKGAGTQDDAAVYNHPDWVNRNFSSETDFLALSWTFQGTPGTARQFFRFNGLSTIPAGTTIVSATLTLTGVTTSAAAPQGNSYYPGSPYNSSGTNPAWIKRVTGSWTATSITWNNQPTTTTTNQVAIPASTSQWNYSVTLNVTSLVQDIVNSGQNNGLSMQLQTEAYYRSLIFTGPRNTNIAGRPKLVITYEI
ncbi:DNRLRE domain-containing protein [Chitinophaga varians]|uniref:DNRLRE domain-containing protein n=1 Tax=Chitinophaga varians TaxID=2202339 RepID=A0A847RM86_9BACT|nr:DNRLRE domain-containing protein [Chitinophaga varians]NLR64183.1 DNRLRE domain-containing protein [Chitinophaga varians]